MSKSKTDNSSGDGLPLNWPSEGTELRDLVDYLKDSTGCAAITIHSDEEGEEHISYYAKSDCVERRVLDSIRERGFFIHLAGQGKTPPSASPNSWIAFNCESEMTGWVEIRRE